MTARCDDSVEPGAPRSALAVLLGVAVSALLGCSDPEREGASRPDLETVEVAPSPDAALSTADDPQAVRRPPEVAGVLPSDFPPDVPLYRPSSLVDFGEDPTGRPYVLFFTPDPPGQVEARLGADLERQGWRAAGGAGGLRRFRNEGREVTVGVSRASGGTEIRLTYPPRR